MKTAMSRPRRVYGSLLSTVLLGGCVSQSSYDALKAQNEQLQAQVQTQQAQIDADKVQNQQLQQQLQSQQAQIDADNAQLARVRGIIRTTR